MDHRETIREYYRCYKDRDRESLRSILHQDMTHSSEWATYTDRDTMLEEIWPSVGATRAVDLRIFGDHPEYMVRYRVTGGDRPSRHMSEYIRMKGDKIAEIEVFLGRETED